MHFFDAQASYFHMLLEFSVATKIILASASGEVCRLKCQNVLAVGRSDKLTNTFLSLHFRLLLQEKAALRRPPSRPVSYVIFKMSYGIINWRYHQRWIQRRLCWPSSRLRSRSKPSAATPRSSLRDQTNFQTVPRNRIRVARKPPIADVGLRERGGDGK